MAQSVLVQGRRSLLHVSYAELKGKTENELAAEIRRFFASAGFANARVQLNFPRHLGIVRFLKVPSTDAAEIRKMAKMEVLKQLPYAEEEIVHGCRLVAKSEDGYATVLLAMAQKSVLDKFLRLLTGAGIAVEKIVIGSESLFVWFAESGRLKSEETALLANFDSQDLDVDVIRKGALVFSRGVWLEEGAISQSEVIMSQVRASVQSYQTESGQSVDKVYLCGPSEMLEPQKSLFAERLNLPVEVIDPLKDPRLERYVGLKTCITSFAEVMGIALGPGEIEIDLLPEEAAFESQARMLKKRLVLSGLLLASVILLAAALAGKRYTDEISLIRYFDSEIRKNQSRLSDIKKKEADADLVRQYAGRRPFAIDALREVYAVVQPGTVITMLDYDSDRALTLRGSASRLGDVFQMTEKLGRSPWFESANVRYVNKRKEGGGEPADFEILCRLAKEKDEKRK